MSIRKINFVEGEYYHIYNRGNSKQKIFNDKEDYLRFISLLYISNSNEGFRFFNTSRNMSIYEIDKGSPLVSIGAYCLMPNHFHILITQKKKNGISQFMQKLSTGYSMYYNKKYERTGSLFEGKFKSQHLGTDKYLKYLFSYIHLNPVKLIQNDWKEKGIKNKKDVIDYLEKYSYSSYLDYLNFESKRPEFNILTPNFFPEYFPTKDKFQKEIFEWLSYDIMQS
ncbi:MAG: transposase [bacterium]